MQLGSIHHLTAITADPSANHDFYTRVLGLRLVKKTVNQDDVSAYHLFYADGRGAPGSDMTFFDWPAPRAVHGRQSISRTSFRVPADGLGWWRDWFATNDVAHGEITERLGRETLDFSDAEGQRLRLTADARDGEAHVWAKSPVPAERQILGLGPITLTLADLAPTERVLSEVMNMRHAGSVEGADEPGAITHMFEMGEGGAAAELHLVIAPDLSPASPGAGGVHHVAFHIPDDAYDAWTARLSEKGMNSSGPIDRFYFKSLYFREPGGVLFEIATDGPGFAADEPLERLGQSLSLPPFLENRRAEIEAGLRPID